MKFIYHWIYRIKLSRMSAKELEQELIQLLEEQS